MESGHYSEPVKKFESFFACHLEQIKLSFYWHKYMCIEILLFTYSTFPLFHSCFTRSEAWNLIRGSGHSSSTLGALWVWGAYEGPSRNVIILSRLKSATVWSKAQSVSPQSHTAPDRMLPSIVLKCGQSRAPTPILSQSKKVPISRWMLPISRWMLYTLNTALADFRHTCGRSLISKWLRDTAFIEIWHSLQMDKTLVSRY